MYNFQRIVQSIKDIERFFAELEMITKESKNLDDPKIFHSLSMLCLGIINRAIDLGTEILIKEAISMPSRYKDIFVPLSKKGIISKELGTEMEELTGHRNYLAHEYFGLDKKRLSRILRKIGFVEEFVERIKKIIKVK